MTSCEPLPTVAGKGELVVHVLGSGSGVPTAQRDTSSLVVGVAVVRLARDADILLHACGAPQRMRETFSERLSRG